MPLTAKQGSNPDPEHVVGAVKATLRVDQEPSRNGGRCGLADRETGGPNDENTRTDESGAAGQSAAQTKISVSGSSTAPGWRRQLSLRPNLDCHPGEIEG